VIYLSSDVENAIYKGGEEIADQIRRSRGAIDLQLRQRVIRKVRSGSGKITLK